VGLLNVAGGAIFWVFNFSEVVLRFALEFKKNSVSALSLQEAGERVLRAEAVEANVLGDFAGLFAVTSALDEGSFRKANLSLATFDVDILVFVRFA